MHPGRAVRKALTLTLEREKDMELNSIMQALVKDLAEQMRPMVAEMVRQEWTALAAVPAVGLGQLEMIAHFVSLELLAGEIDLSKLAGELDTEKIAEHFDLAALARHINPDALAGELTDGHMEKIANELTIGQLSDIADHVSMSDLASHLDTAKIAEDLDLDHAIGEWFSNQSFDIRVS